jgi:type VI secretion system protein ImpH
MDFLPQGSAWEPLRAITRFFSGDAIDFEVQLVLRRDEVPACELEEEPDTTGPQLGWTTWVRTARLNRDADDTILRLNEVIS